MRDRFDLMLILVYVIGLFVGMVVYKESHAGIGFWFTQLLLMFFVSLAYRLFSD